MPFANFKFPEGVVDAARKEEIIHRTTAMFVEYFGEQARPYDFVLEGATDAATATGQTAPYAEAGLTWWIEAFGYWRGGVAVAAERIAQGPTGPAAAKLVP